MPLLWLAECAESDLEAMLGGGDEGRCQPLLVVFENRRDLPERVVRLAGLVGVGVEKPVGGAEAGEADEVVATVSDITFPRSLAGVHPVDHTGELPGAPQHVAGMEIPVDERRRV